MNHVEDYNRLLGIAVKVYPYFDGLSKSDIDVVIFHIKDFISNSPIKTAEYINERYENKTA